MEKLWARVKNSIAKIYSKTSTLKEVRQKLLKKFEYLKTEIGKESVGRILRYVDRVVAKVLTDVNQDEEMERSSTETHRSHESSGSPSEIISQ